MFRWEWRLAYLSKVVLLHEGVGLFVGKALIAIYDGISKLDLGDVGAVVESDEASLGQTVFGFDELAETVRECMWQHGDDCAD